jgi:hypothetical protein
VSQYTLQGFTYYYALAKIRTSRKPVNCEVNGENYVFYDYIIYDNKEISAFYTYTKYEEPFRKIIFWYMNSDINNCTKIRQLSQLMQKYILQDRIDLTTKTNYYREPEGGRYLHRDLGLFGEFIQSIEDHSYRRRAAKRALLQKTTMPTELIDYEILAYLF